MTYKASDRLYGSGTPPQVQITGWDDATTSFNVARVDQFGKLASDNYVYDVGGMTWVPAESNPVASIVGVLDAASSRINPARDETLARLNGFSIPVYDYISLGYTGLNLTTVTYKLGGSSGTTVATLTLGYAGSDLTSVTRS